MAFISKATKANWLRLGTDSSNRLTRRANKKRSKKCFVPKEYLVNPESKRAIEQIVDMVRENDYSVHDVVYTLCLLKLQQYSLCSQDWEMRDYISDCLQSSFGIIEELASVSFPKNEFDFVGAVYQSLKSEGSKNEHGSYYTPFAIAQEMCLGITASRDNAILDPCCGTGAILLAVNCSDPYALYGCDNDPLAIMICRTNIFCRFPHEVFVPNVVCANYLTEQVFWNCSFSAIITNPPWGAVTDYLSDIDSTIMTKERSSLFLEKAISSIGVQGIVSFLLPKAIMNIAAHSEIREYILQHTSIEAITQYSNIFTGVTTALFNIVLKKGVTQNRSIKVRRGEIVFEVDSRLFANNEKKIFRLLPKEDFELQEKIEKQCSWDLSNSIWALGIVTGDNKGKVFDTFSEGREPVFTGKEIEMFRLDAPRKYLIFDPDNFQQVAREEYYRANEKLIYKFISNKLTFALDTTGALCLNSANILIPRVPKMSIKTVAALLNSKLYQYLYLVMFDDPKILKGNLEKLPFPDITEQDNERIASSVDLFLSGQAGIEDINKEINRLFQLSPDDIARIEEVTNGTA